MPQPYANRAPPTRQLQNTIFLSPDVALRQYSHCFIHLGAELSFFDEIFMQLLFSERNN